MSTASRETSRSTRSRISSKGGLPPGTLVHVGQSQAEAPSISLIDYGHGRFDKRQLDTAEEVLAYRESDSITWVNISGLANVSIIETIGTHFNIHRLVLEDILNTHQRPKCEVHEDCLYLVLKGLSLSTGLVGHQVHQEQISVLLLKGFVFTFEERPGRTFAPIQARIEANLSRFSNLGADYLAYAILDGIVDEYFELEEVLADTIDEIEEELLVEPSATTLARIQQLRRTLIILRRAVSPLRELLNVVLRTSTPLVQPANHIYFRDVYDHCLRITESLESSRDMVTGLLDIYVSSVSNKMNQVMKVLTVFASIFIPLTFITGIYGMNFDVMPELHYPWAYPALWALFICIPAILLVFFKRKGWL